MTDYADDVPILSRESYQEERFCECCEKVLPKGPIRHFIEVGEEPFQKREVCLSCLRGQTKK